MLVLLALAEGNGGFLANMEPAQQKNVATPPSSVTQLHSFTQSEAQAETLWDGCAYEARKSGTPLEAVVGREGICAVTAYTNIVRGCRNRKAALAYINSASFRPRHALHTGSAALPTTDMALGELAADILINSTERAALKRPIDWTLHERT